MTPREWGEIGLGGAVSAVITAVGAYFVKTADRVKPDSLTVSQIT